MLALSMLTACSSLLEDSLTTKSPNAPDSSTIEKLIAGTGVGLGVIMEDTEVRIAMMWDGHLAGGGRQHLTFGNYIVSAGTFDWGNQYSVAANARILQDQAGASNLSRPKGVGQIMEAMIIAKLASLYGDIPYSEAFDYENHPKPKFDKMSEVYTALHTVLADAANNLTGGAATGSIPTTEDFFFHGSAAKWAAVAHTLNARLYLHEGNYASAKAEALLGVSSSANDMLMPHGSAYGVDQNLHNVFFDINRPGDTYCGPPTFLTGFMLAHTTAGTDESRLYDHYFMDGGVYTGDTDPNTDHPDYGYGAADQNGFYGYTAPVPLVTFYENQLILAEAEVFLNGVTATALAAINSVRADLRNSNAMYGLTLDSPAGLNYPDYVGGDFANADAFKKEVHATKYIMLYGQLEAYNELRRTAKFDPTNMVVVPPVPGAVTPTGTIPNRFIYPQAEINTNGANVPAGSGIGGVDDQWQKLELWK